MAKDQSYQQIREEREQYIAQIKKYEELARSNPKRYLSKVKGFAALGRIFVYGLLILAVLFTVGMVLAMTYGSARAALGKLALVGIIFIFMIVKSLFVKFPKPEGLEIKRDDAPELFDMIESLRAQLDTPMIHRVILTEDFNAFASQRPRWGMMGPLENTLAIGLPYMASVSYEELRSTVAHEFGHFSGGHSAFAGEIYRVMATWQQLYVSMTQNGGSASIIAIFLNWYMPRLDALTFALRRANEYEADAAAAKVGAARANATDLMKFAVQGRHVMTDLWRRIYDQVTERPEPPVNSLGFVMDQLKTPVERDQAVEWLKEAFETETSYADTHPSLTDRVKALNEMPDVENIEALAEEIRQMPEQSAAERLLGQRLPSLVQAIDARWREEVKQGWLMEYERRRYAASQLQSMAPAEDETPEQMVARANLLAELKGLKEAIPLFRQALDRDPNQALARFAVGMHCADEKDPDTEVHLIKAAELDPQLAPACYERLLQIYDAAGDVSKAEHYYNLLQGERQRAELAHKHVVELTAGDKLAPASVSADSIARYQSQLQRFNVEAAYVIRKEPKDGSTPVDMLIVVPKLSLLEAGMQGENNRIEEILNGLTDVNDLYLRVITSREGAVKKMLEKKHADARIWPAAQSGSAAA